mgnify:CR=1 FL=1
MKTSDEVVVEAAMEMLRTVPAVVEDEEAILNPPQLSSAMQAPKRIFTFQTLMKADPSTLSSLKPRDFELPGKSQEKTILTTRVCMLHRHDVRE